jgi:hypothetical protein
MGLIVDRLRIWLGISLLSDSEARVSTRPSNRSLAGPWFVSARFGHDVGRYEVGFEAGGVKLKMDKSARSQQIEAANHAICAVLRIYDSMSPVDYFFVDFYCSKLRF